jgi:hypothetical protein
MVELGQSRDEPLKGRVIMGVADNTLSVAAKCRYRIRDFRRIAAED